VSLSQLQRPPPFQGARVIFGGTYWIWIWVAILALGIAGFISAVNWGRHTNWKNLDEILRGAGTILVSIGMILLLQDTLHIFASLLLFSALVMFVSAFVVGRKNE
jgi:predicted MFS family arabinose efflux permease